MLHIKEFTVIYIRVCYNIRVGEETNLQQLENLINFSAMAKPKARYTFSGVESVSFTSYSISFRFSDGDSLDVDFPSSSGRKFIHEEIRDFLKWYGKDDRKQLEETSKVLIKLLEAKEAKA